MPLLFRQDKPLMGVWKITETADEFAAMLDDESLFEHELVSIRSVSRKTEKLATNILLKELIGKETAVLHNSTGAPYLLNEPYNISISHTKGYVAVLLVPKEDYAGVDIEYNSDRVCKVKDRFLSQSEKAFIDHNFESEHLLLCWCAKETLYKIIGVPGADFTSHLHILPFRFARTGIIKVYDSCTDNPRHFSLCYRVGVEYTLVWVMNNGDVAPLSL